VQGIRSFAPGSRSQCAFRHSTVYRFQPDPERSSRESQGVEFLKHKEPASLPLGFGVDSAPPD